MSARPESAALYVLWGPSPYAPNTHASHAMTSTLENLADRLAENGVELVGPVNAPGRYAARGPDSNAYEVRVLGAAPDTAQADDALDEEAFLLHDLANLLSGASLALASVDQPEARVRQARSSLTAMGELIKRRRDARLSHTVPLDRLADQLTALLSPHAQARGVHLDIGNAPQGLGLHAVAERLLFNLGLNAIQACEKGGRLKIDFRTTGAQALRITVADTGRGMDADTLARFMERGFSAQAGTGHNQGLGMSIVQHGLAKLQGRLRCESAPGKGTTLELELVAERLATQSLRAPKVTASRSEAMLIVDDNEVLSELLADYLRARGHQVDVAGTLEEAKAYLGGSYGWVFADRELPDGDGNEILQSLAERGHPAHKLVCMTGSVTRAHAQPGGQLIQKPFDLSDIDRILGADEMTLS